MKKSSKILTLLIAIVLSFSLFALTACSNGNSSDRKVVRISTTTSVNDSGLMEYLQPYFEADTGYKWEISSAGTGAAIAAATYGNADVILVHSKKSEDEFVEQGFARKTDGYLAERISFMNNYFVLVGPTGSTINTATVKDAFNDIFTNKYKFISRGDKSGTHNKEITLWPDAMAQLFEGGKITNDITKIPAGILYNEKTNPDGFYVSAGSGMGACLTMANEMNAYCLTDKATFLSMKNDPSGDKLPKLSILKESDKDMKNTYTMIAVNPDAPFKDAGGNLLPKGSVKVDTIAADVFINWMNSIHARSLIKQYGIEQYGEQLFFLENYSNFVVPEIIG